MSTRISIELVPRSQERLVEELSQVAAQNLATINVPDLLRMPLRSWDACAAAKQERPNFCAIPHIRSMDFEVTDKEPVFVSVLRAAQIDEVVLVTGDAPQDMRQQVYETTPLNYLETLRTLLPGVRIYGALDPYRSSMRDETDYIKSKIDAGFDGFFTQPFFDIRLMDIYSEIMASQTVFWGISPVIAAGSRAYWETKNRAVFPAEFRPDLNWNVDFARRALSWVHDHDAHAYLMPIRVPIEEYLPPIFAQ